jgi:hypothetical protein
MLAGFLREEYFWARYEFEVIDTRPTISFS